MCKTPEKMADKTSMGPRWVPTVPGWDRECLRYAQARPLGVSAGPITVSAKNVRKKRVVRPLHALLYPGLCAFSLFACLERGLFLADGLVALLALQHDVRTGDLFVGLLT